MSSLTAELPAIQVALQHLLLLMDSRPAVVTNCGFMDSRGALCQLSHLARATPFVRQIADKCHAFEGTGWSLTLQLISSNSGIAENDKADELAAASRKDDVPTHFLESFTEAKSIIQTRIMS